MLLRIAMISALALSVAGCSNSTTFGGPQGLTNASLQPVTSAAAAGTIDIQAELSGKKTMGGKMLSAIALERVTGRKPDPARFSNLD